MRRLSSLLILSMVLLGCAKQTDFLYEKIPQANDAPIDRWVEPHHDKVQDEKYQITDFLPETGFRPLDILWVIDNSGSMSEEQTKIRNNALVFMQTFTQRKHIRWRMGLVSTDVSEYPYIGLDQGQELDNSTVDPVNSFMNAVSRLGINGSPTEKPFDCALKGLRNGFNFARENAVMAIFIVTDESEQSYLSSKDFIDEVNKVRGSKLDLLVYPVLSGGALDYPGERQKYDDLVTLTGTQIYQTLSSDFGKKLAEVGQDLVEKLKITMPKIYLKKRPVPDTIELSIDGRFIPGGAKSTGGSWTYQVEGNLIEIHNEELLDELDEDAVVEVTYVEDDEIKRPNKRPGCVGANCGRPGDQENK